MAGQDPINIIFLHSLLPHSIAFNHATVCTKNVGIALPAARTEHMFVSDGRQLVIKKEASRRAVLAVLAFYQLPREAKESAMLGPEQDLCKLRLVGCVPFDVEPTRVFR